MNVKKLFYSAAAGAATMLAMPDDASATVGYVCEAYFSHYSGYGNHGYVYVNVRTAPNCGGDWVNGAVYCTTGGSGNLCNSGHLNTAAEIAALIQNLQRAAAADQKVDVVATTGGAGLWVSFRSD